jgi:DNA-binding HxlR family transcriptional regulator
VVETARNVGDTEIHSGRQVFTKTPAVCRNCLGHDAEHFVTHLELGHANADLHDGAGKVLAQDDRETVFEHTFQRARSQQRVEPVQRRRPDPDLDLPRRRYRLGHVSHDRRNAVTVDYYCTHTIGLSVGPARHPPVTPNHPFVGYSLFPTWILRNAEGMREDGTSPGATHTHVPLTVDQEACPLRDVLDRVGDKWSVLVMAMLGGGPRRYSDLRRAIDGISQRMLTLTLRGLTRDGLVIRTVTPSTPPQVHYALTPVGQTLAVEVRSLIEWSERHREYITQHRRHHDAQRVDNPR